MSVSVCSAALTSPLSVLSLALKPLKWIFCLSCKPHISKHHHSSFSLTHSHSALCSCWSMFGCVCPSGYSARQSNHLLHPKPTLISVWWGWWGWCHVAQETQRGSAPWTELTQQMFTFNISAKHRSDLLYMSKASYHTGNAAKLVTTVRVFCNRYTTGYFLRRPRDIWSYFCGFS